MMERAHDGVTQRSAQGGGAEQLSAPPGFDGLDMGLGADSSGDIPDEVDSETVAEVADGSGATMLLSAHLMRMGALERPLEETLAVLDSLEELARFALDPMLLGDVGETRETGETLEAVPFAAPCEPAVVTEEAVVAEAAMAVDENPIAAFETLYRTMRDGLVGFAASLLRGDQEIAADVVQLAALRVWTHWDEAMKHTPATRRYYLARAVQHAAYDQGRRLKYAPEQALRGTHRIHKHAAACGVIGDKVASDKEPWDALRSVPTVEGDPERTALAREALVEVLRMCTSKRQRLVVGMVLAGFDYPEIRERLLARGFAPEKVKLGSLRMDLYLLREQWRTRLRVELESEAQGATGSAGGPRRAVAS